MWSHDDFFFFTVIGGKWINITIDITVGKYNVSSLSDGFDQVVTTFMCLLLLLHSLSSKLYTFVYVMQLCNYMSANKFSCFWLVSSAGCIWGFWIYWCVGGKCKLCFHMHAKLMYSFKVWKSFWLHHNIYSIHRWPSVRSKWLEIGCVLFFFFYGLRDHLLQLPHTPPCPKITKFLSPPTQCFSCTGSKRASLIIGFIRYIYCTAQG